MHEPLCRAAYIACGTLYGEAPAYGIHYSEYECYQRRIECGQLGGGAYILMRQLYLQ